MVFKMMGTEYIDCGKNFTLNDRINATTDSSLVAFRSLGRMTLNALEFGLLGLPVGVGLHVMTMALGASVTGQVLSLHGELVWGLPALVFSIAWCVFFVVDYLQPRRLYGRLSRIIANIANTEPELVHYPAHFRFAYKKHVFESNCSALVIPAKNQRQRQRRCRLLTLSYYYHEGRYLWRTYESPLFELRFGDFTAYFTHDSQRLICSMELKTKLTEEMIADCLDKLVVIVDENTVQHSADILTSNFPKKECSVRLDHATLAFDGTACQITLTRKDRMKEMTSRLFCPQSLRIVGFTLSVACGCLYWGEFSLFVLISTFSYMVVAAPIRCLRDLSCRSIPYEDLSYIILDEEDEVLIVNYKYHTIPRSLQLHIKTVNRGELQDCLPALSKHIDKIDRPNRKMAVWLIPAGAAFCYAILFIVLRSQGRLPTEGVVLLIFSLYFWIVYAIVDIIEHKEG